MEPLNWESTAIAAIMSFIFVANLPLPMELYSQTVLLVVATQSWYPVPLQQLQVLVLIQHLQQVRDLCMVMSWCQQLLPLNSPGVIIGSVFGGLVALLIAVVVTAVVLNYIMSHVCGYKTETMPEINDIGKYLYTVISTLSHNNIVHA